MICPSTFNLLRSHTSKLLALPSLIYYTLRKKFVCFSTDDLLHSLMFVSRLISLAVTCSANAVETFLWCVNSVAVVAIQVNNVLTVSCNHLLSLLFTTPGQGVTDFPINDTGNSLFAFLTTLSVILKTEFSGRLIALLDFFKVSVEKVKKHHRLEVKMEVQRIWKTGHNDGKDVLP